MNDPLVMKPLIKWSGGKGDEIKLFKDYIPDYDVYIEPFVGGGSLFFDLEPEKAVINDVHKELIALYQSIQDGYSQDIHTFMNDNKNDEQTFYYIRDEFTATTPLDVAKRFYYQRKTCFRGMLRYNKKGHFNIPYGKYKTIHYDDLLNNSYETLLKRTRILSVDFEDIFKEYNDTNNFMFLDPPYDSPFTDYGYCSFGKEEHKRLAKCFKETNNKCLMIIGETTFIKELYSDYIVGSYDKKYRFKLYDNRITDSINNKHLIIKNF